MLSMLSLNTLKVEASSSSFSLGSSVIYTYDGVDTAVNVSGYISSVSGGGGYISSGTGTISSNSGGGGSISSLSTKAGSFNAHVKMPFSIIKSFSDLGLSDISGDEFVKIDTSISSITTTSSGASSFSASNFGVYSSAGELLSSGSSSLSLPTQIYQVSKISDASNNIILNYVIEYDVEGSSLLQTYQNTPNVTINTTFSGSINCNFATTQEVSNSSAPVTDTKSHELQEESNEIQQDSNTTTHNIFDSISDFFGSFFDNLVHIFVPEDGYFTSWFNRLNTLLTDKLGILYFPFSFTIDFFSEFNNSFDTSSGLQGNFIFPEIKFTNPVTSESYVLIQRQEISLANYSFPISSSENSSLIGNGGFNTLRNIVKGLFNFVIVFSLLSLFRKKLNLIIRGSDYDS